MKHLLAAAFALLITPAVAFAADININTADQATLEALEGIGPAKAAAIVEYREANGPFTSLDQLTAVSGIGEATLEANRDQLTVK
jgi:competence protein ComEA